MEVRRSSHFFSLRWKFILSLIAMLVLVSAVIGVLAMRRMQQQLDHMLTQQYQMLYHDYQVQLGTEQERLIGLSQELNLMLRNAEQRLEYQHMASMVAENWGDFELFWRLHGLQLIDEEHQVHINAGQPFVVEPSWLERSLHSGEPIHRIRCQARCFMEVAIPMLVNGEINLLVFVTGLEQVLAQLTEKNQIELAILANESFRQGPWQRKVLSITNRANNMQLLNVASENVGLSTLQNAPERVSLFGNDWAFYGWPVTDQGESMLLFRDINQLAANERAFWFELLGMLGLAIVLSCSLGALLFWGPLARIKRLGSALPLMAQSRFEELRTRLHMDDGGYRDELQQLEHTTLNVAEQLERLEGDVERYTQELQRMAMIDALTGLPNRAMFHHELGKSLASIGRTDEQIALLFLDLDEFKRVNDTLGHDVGDELLKTVSKRLQKSVRNMDTVCRLGGDEFTVIARGLEAESDIHRIIHQIFSSLQQPLQLGRHTLIITTSIGVVFCDNPMMRPEELLKRADLAMYQAKKAGRSNYRVFNEQMLELASRRLELEQEIRSAIQQAQMTLALQPIVALSNGQIVGFEALCRWHHPQRGLVMPNEYLKDIEASEQSVMLGCFVLDYALHQLARLSEQLQRDDFYLSINLSPNQYLHPSLVDRLSQKMAEYQLQPKRVMLEITEAVLIKNRERATQIMHQLKSIGVRIAIDDFGTGYSSLSYLKQLPFDVLKVDKGFVSELDNSDVDRNIVTSVIDLAHNLKRMVIAEGIENHDQRQFLLQAKCDYGQGFLYTQPLEEAQMLQHLMRIGPEFIWRQQEWRLGRRLKSTAADNSQTPPPLET